MPIQLINPKEEHFNLIDELIEQAFDRKAEAHLVRNLRNNSTAYDPMLEFVVIKDQWAIAHILYTHAFVIQGDLKHPTLAMAPVSVHPNYQRKGIGTHLITDTLQTLKEKNIESVFVLGHEKFYPKFGFKPSHKWNIQAPFPVPEDALIAIELVPDSLKNVTGTLEYAVEFYTTADL